MSEEQKVRQMEALVLDKLRQREGLIRRLAQDGLAKDMLDKLMVEMMACYILGRIHTPIEIPGAFKGDNR